MSAVAEREPDVVVVDLDAMPTRDLRREQQQVKDEITEIKLQLGDPARRVGLGEDYPAWKRRAMLALMHKERERQEIHAVLKGREREREIARLQRRDVNRAKNEADKRAADERRAQRKAPPSRFIDDVAERRAAIVAAFTKDEGINGLLLRIAVAVHHITSDALPESVTRADRKAISELSDFLKAIYGSGVLAALKNGKLEGVEP